MLRTKWTVGLRNKLSDLVKELNSYAIIAGAGMSEAERRVFKRKLKDTIGWIDDKILPYK